MPVTDDDLLGLLAAPRGPRSACPPADTLARAAAGPLDTAERERVLDHVVRCADCAEELRAVLPLEAWAAAAAPRLPRRERRPAAARRRPPRWTAWAAAAALAAAASALLWRAEGPAVLRARRVALPHSLLPEGAALARGACRLRWSDAGGGARYAVSVLSKDLRPLAAADGLERPEYVVPAPALQSVPEGAEIVWSVEARWPDGHRLASPTFVTRLR